MFLIVKAELYLGWLGKKERRNLVGVCLSKLLVLGAMTQMTMILHTRQQTVRICVQHREQATNAIQNELRHMIIATYIAIYSI